MSLLLAPYTHAMRLGQGFNSYTQQICIDDAVVIDEQRPENVVTNDGTTMRIMAQKSATPSAWTRQKEVIVGSQATAVLEENARKAKAEVELITKLIEEPAEEPSNDVEGGSDSDSKVIAKAAVKKDSAAAADKSEVAEPEESSPPEEADEEPSAEDSGSIDDLADADEAREIDAPVADEGTAQEPQSASVTAATAKPAVKVDQPKATTTGAVSAPKKTAKVTRGRSSSTTPASASASSTVPKTANKPISSQPTQPKGDVDEVDREAIMANLQANAPKGEVAERGEIAANIGNNADKSVQKKPIKRGASSDRARQIQSAAPAGAPDRAAVKAALTGKPKPDAAKIAKDEAEAARREQEEAEILAEQRRYRKQLEQEQRKDEIARRAEDREEQRQIRAEKRAWDVKRREEARKAIDAAADVTSATLEDLEKIRAQNQFVERFNGMTEQTEKYDFDPTAPRGPSQTVTYTSRFVDRLSDVMDDMSVSGSLSIKAGKVGGSGKGSFVDSDKFKESDLNFYISVKVVNQTINFKDALVYNPLRSVDKDNFREVYGDSFISGFVEGGEFNALVSMKILNKAKMTDIKASAKIALTAGAVQIKADANVGIAKSNIETNTETTIQVSWSGGGHIKPMEQQWDIQSLMAAAARFPDLVAECPQRTYAILTKYDALRSFVARKPASYTPLQYENAQIYTNTLLDSFISYKAMYKRLGEQIFGVQGKTLEIIPWGDAEKGNVATRPNPTPIMGGSKNKDTGLYPFTEIDSKFEATTKGLSDARTAIRRQMARIVNEVDAIEKDPKLATDEDHVEPYQSPVAFEARIPVVEVPERLRIKSHPLSGKLIAAKVLTPEEQKEQLEKEEKLAGDVSLYEGADKLEPYETTAMDEILSTSPALSADFRASNAAGAADQGKPFNNLDFLKKSWEIRSIRVEMADGALVYLAVSYENGLLVEKGASRDKKRVKTFGPFLKGERVTSAAIEYGREMTEAKNGLPLQVLGLRLFTNRGRGLIARALKTRPIQKGDRKGTERDGCSYEDINVLYLDLPFSSGTIKGFFGRSDDGPKGKIYRLGLIWSQLPELSLDEREAPYDTTTDVAGADEEDRAQLEEDQRRAVADLSKELATAKENLANTQGKVVELEKDREKNPTFETQSGAFYAGDRGWRNGENSFARCSIEFPRRYPKAPRLLFGLNMVDADSGRTRALSLAFPEVSATGFNVQAASFAGCIGYNIGCSWMTLPNDIHLETGMVNTYGANRETENHTEHVYFTQSFDSPPKVLVWFQEFEWPSRDWLSIKCGAFEVTSHSFKLKIESWAGRKFKNARVQYLAYPAEEHGRRVRSDRNNVNRGQKELNQPRTPFHGGPFKNTPKTFIAIAELDFGPGRNLRFRCSANAPNNRELEWSYGTWSDSDMDHAEVQWIAIE